MTTTVFGKNVYPQEKWNKGERHKGKEQTKNKRNFIKELALSVVYLHKIPMFK